jgi:hypothetical protein
LEIKTLIVIGRREGRNIYQLIQDLVREKVPLAILFIDEAIELLSDEENFKDMGKTEIYILGDHIGISSKGDYRSIDYRDWVKLLEECGRVISWT